MIEQFYEVNDKGLTTFRFTFKKENVKTISGVNVEILTGLT